MSTNNFKLFDESKSNLLTYSNYNSNTQRQSGFQTDEEIPSALFNSVLRQNTLLSYCFIEYAKTYVSDAITIQHDMTTSDMISFLTKFFKNKLTPNQINVDSNSAGDIFYVKTEPEQKLVALHSPANSTTKKFVLSYEYNAGEDKMMPYVREFVFEEHTNLTPSNVGVYAVFQELTDLDITNLNDFEILLEMKDTSNNHFESIVIPLSRLSAIGYYQVSTEYTITGLEQTFINFEKSFFIGLSNTTSEAQNPIIGKYLCIMSTSSDITTCKFNVTLKERI